MLEIESQHLTWVGPLCLGSFGYTSLSFKVFLVEIFTDWVEKKLLKRLVHTYNPYRDFKNGLKGAKSQNGSLKRASNITIFKLHKYWDSCTLETFDICNLEFKRWKVVMDNMFWLSNNVRGFLQTRIYLLVSRRINPNFWWTLLNFVWTLVYFWMVWSSQISGCLAQLYISVEIT